jgi:transposase
MPAFVGIAGGLDVHRDTIVACIPDAWGHYVVKTFGTFKNELRDLAQFLKDGGVELASMESTGVYWRDCYNILREAGVNVQVVNARHVKNVPGHKTDVVDARWLATLTRAGLLNASRVLDKGDDEVRELSRLRKKHVQTASSIKNRIIKLLVKGGFNVSQVVTDVFGKTGQIIIDGLMAGAAPEKILLGIQSTVGYRLKAKKQQIIDALEGEMSSTLRFTLERELESLAFHERMVDEYDGMLARHEVEADREHDRAILETLPGMSRVSATSLLVELGNDIPGDFRSANALASWSGLCPGNNMSAGKRRSGKTPNGSPHIKTIMCEVASAAVRCKGSYFHLKYCTLKPRLGHKKAIMAIACKMLKYIWHMLTKKEPYKDRAADYGEMVAKKNAPRWIRNLRDMGFTVTLEEGRE